MMVADDGGDDDDHISIYAYASLRLTHGLKKHYLLLATLFQRINNFFFLLAFPFTRIYVHL